MLSGERIPCCPHCGQLLTGHRYGVRFGQLAQRLIDAVQRAGPDGIHTELLFDMVYSDRPGANRSTLKAYVYWINRRLAETSDVRLRANRSGVYRVVSVVSKAAAE